MVGGFYRYVNLKLFEFNKKRLVIVQCVVRLSTEKGLIRSNDR